MARKHLVIGLLWHSVNSHNLGVGALTLSNIAIIRRRAASQGIDVDFVIIGWRDNREPYVSGPNVKMVPFQPRSILRRPDRLISVIRDCDVIFDIGGGDSFSDLYGVKRFIYLYLTKALVLACGRPLLLSPQTIGPFRRRWVRLLAVSAMKRAHAVVARDHLSSDLLREMGIVENSCRAIDVAFELPAEGAAPESKARVKVGINVSGLLFNGGPDVGRRIGLAVDYPTLIESVIDHFDKAEDCEVHLIGHVFSSDPLEDDRRAITALIERFPSAVLAPDFTSPSAAKAYIAGMDFFAGARMHACIAAFSSCVPVVPMAYSRKFAGLFGSLGYDWVADCTTEDAATILEKLVRGFHQRGQLRERVSKGLEIAHEKLAVYDAVVDDGLAAASAKRLRTQHVSETA